MRTVSPQSRHALNAVVGWVMLGLLSAGSLSAQNLLSNGDFNLPNSTAAPTSWSIWTYAINPANTWANHANDSFGLDGSFYMQVGSSENGTSGAGLYQIVPGAPGYTYGLAVASGAQNWWWPVGEMRLFFLDASSNELSSSVGVVTAGITDYGTGLP